VTKEIIAPKEIKETSLWKFRIGIIFFIPDDCVAQY